MRNCTLPQFNRSLLFVFLLSFACSVMPQSGFAQVNLALLGHLTYPGNTTCANITGFVDTAGNEYALVGASTGLSIVDINGATPVQLFQVPGPNNLWKEVRAYNGFAYVTTEATSGLQVVDLRWLPDSIGYHTINPGTMTTSHTIFIDEHGIAYVNGTDQGLLFLDLNANAWNPPLLGKFTLNYVHDCFARGDTLWAACINDGFVRVVNVADKTDADNPAKTMAIWETPNSFSHNCWPSDDNKYLFTTDEKPDSYLACYDVQNMNNVTEKDREQSDPGSNTIIHNTYYLNDYCITSYYTYGITIHDVSRKHNLVEVGHYDTAPTLSGDGFHGAWGVWPYLPSGKIIASDIETGLWVFQPTYQRACYVEGVVWDSICNAPLGGVTVTLLADGATTTTANDGSYSFGTVNAGVWALTFDKPGFQGTTFLTTVTNGQLIVRNVTMIPISTASVNVHTTNASGNALANVKLMFVDTAGNREEFETDANGDLELCNFLQGNYDLYAGKWSFVTQKTTPTINAGINNLQLQLSNGYYDDFIFDYGWTVTGNASAGTWEIGEPVGTEFNTPDDSNPEDDVAGDFLDQAYITGNGGGQAGSDDVDNGATVLTSPVFDISNMGDAYLHYYRWFFNDGGNGTDPNDSLVVTITDGAQTFAVETATEGDADESNWKHTVFHLNGVSGNPSTLQMHVRAVDVPQGHLVEGGLDWFMVVDSAPTGIQDIRIEHPLLLAKPNPFGNETALLVTGISSSAQVIITDVLGRTVLVQEVQEGSVVHFGKGIATGMYVAAIKKNGAVLKTARLVKQ